jgi:hypothetical protein
VREARALSGEDRREKLESAAATLEKVEGAGVAPADGGAAAEIDNTNITAALRTESPDLDEIESSLAALSESLQAGIAGTPAGLLDPERANAELRDVLSDPIFQRRVSPLQQLARWLAQATGQADPIGTIWRWIAALIAALSSGALTYLASDRLGNRWLRLGLSALVGLIVGSLFFVATADLAETALVLGAIGIVVAAIAAALIFLGVGRASAPPRPRTVSELAAVLGMGSAEARRKAGEAAAEGDYRSAIRYRCLAVLLDLDEKGRLVFDRSATDREYLFRAPGTLQDDLQPLLTRFEEVWYGNAAAGQEDWTGYDARAGQVEARVAAEAAEQKAGGNRRSAA